MIKIWTLNREWDGIATCTIPFGTLWRMITAFAFVTLSSEALSDPFCNAVCGRLLFPAAILAVQYSGYESTDARSINPQNGINLKRRQADQLNY